MELSPSQGIDPTGIGEILSPHNSVHTPHAECSPQQVWPRLSILLPHWSLSGLVMPSSDHSSGVRLVYGTSLFQNQHRLHHLLNTRVHRSHTRRQQDSTLTTLHRNGDSGNPTRAFTLAKVSLIKRAQAVASSSDTLCLGFEASTFEVLWAFLVI